MGTGADVAMESAGVTLVKGDLRGIVRHAASAADDAKHPPEPVLRLRLQQAGRSARRRRALSLLRTLLTPMIAAAAMTSSSVSVIGNALCGCGTRGCNHIWSAKAGHHYPGRRFPKRAASLFRSESRTQVPSVLKGGGKPSHSNIIHPGKGSIVAQSGNSITYLCPLVPPLEPLVDGRDVEPEAGRLGGMFFPLDVVPLPCVRFELPLGPPE